MEQSVIDRMPIMDYLAFLYDTDRLPNLQDRKLVEDFRRDEQDEKG